MQRLLLLVPPGVLLTGAACQCGPLPGGLLDTPLRSVMMDAGPPPVVVIKPPPPDGGVGYSNQWAGEACPAELFEDSEAMAVDGGLSFGLCVALRGLQGTATHNGNPVSTHINLRFETAAYQSEIRQRTDGDGGYAVQAMRSRYDILKYQPDGVFPTHLGFAEFGVIDLTKNQTRDLAVNSHRIRGSVSFGGVPWTPVTQPADLRLIAVGIPPFQSAATTHNGGAYELRLMEGVFALAAAVPREALGMTELFNYPVSTSTALYADQTVDVQIPSAEFRGTLEIDGQPFPRRTAAFDYQMEFYVPGEQEPWARTFHEGGVSEFRGQLPQGKYAVLLAMESVPDRHLPSAIYNKQLSATIDLTQDATASYSFATVEVEGAILLDGVAIPTAPNAHSFFYFYDLAQRGLPPTLALYEVPMDSATFNLRAFPATYYVALYLHEAYHPDLVEGWYLVDRQKEILTKTQMPIDVLTSPFEGHLTVDGQPAPEGQVVGTLTFQGSAGFYRKRLAVGPQGAFRVRVPKGRYDVYFEIDTTQFPAYATGRQRLVSGLDLANPQVLDLGYETVWVHGPLRVGGEVVGDTLGGGPEVGLSLRRALDGATFTWTHHGGPPDYTLRVPKGDYELTFRILPGAIPDVAHGTAPMGGRLKVP